MTYWIAAIAEITAVLVALPIIGLISIVVSFLEEMFLP